MKRGISPIVAVVLLIAIAVIAAVGLYFWVGSLTGKQATPNTPISIVANPVGSGKVLITNLGPGRLNPSKLNVTRGNISCPDEEIDVGQQVLCNITGTGSMVIYGSGIASTNVQIPSGESCPQGQVLCGGQCYDSGAGVCCDNVWYAGGQCCTDSDCQPGYSCDNHQCLA